MTEAADFQEKQHYFAAFDELRARRDPGWLAAFREAGMKRFAELELPHRKLEAWRFTNVNPIVRTAFRAVIEPSAHGLTPEDIRAHVVSAPDWVEAVFVDGFFAPELSRNLDAMPGFCVGSLLQAAFSSEELVRGLLGSHLDGFCNVFCALNAAFLLDGAWVRIPKGTKASVPIHLVFVTTPRPEATVTFPHNLIIAEPLSESTLIESYISLGSGQGYFNNVVTEINLGAGASMTCAKLLREHRQSYHLSTTRAYQERDTKFLSYSFFIQGKIGRNELSAVLDGEGCDCSLNGLYLLDGDQLVDNAVAIEHRAPHCASWIGYKGVLDDRSHGVFSGKIYVHRGAQRTDSKQLNQNLLLSDTATVNTKPLLEIFADDVKCTHGATVGQPPEEEIFYFRTRGVSEARARGLLTYAFACGAMQELEIAPLRDWLDRYVFDKYSSE